MAEKKATATVKATFRAEPAEAAVKDEAPAAPAKKTAAKKTTVKNAVKTEEKEGTEMEKKTATAATAPKAAAKTTTARTAASKKASAKKTAAKTAVEVTLQWNGNDYTAERLLQSAKDVWQFDLGRDAADFKSAQIYVKPEESKAYVVVNGSENLSFYI